MITITLEEIAAWAKAQPADRQVEMSHFHKYGDKWGSDDEHLSDCGCLMVEYGKEKGFDFDICYGFSWETQDGERIASLLLEETRNYQSQIWDLFSDAHNTNSSPDPITSLEFGIRCSLFNFSGTFGELVKLFKPEYQ
jgi:hypothetical protein